MVTESGRGVLFLQKSRILYLMSIFIMSAIIIYGMAPDCTLIYINLLYCGHPNIQVLFGSNRTVGHHDYIIITTTS